MSEKACKSCGEVKPLEDFYNSTRTADKHSRECKVCERPKLKEASRQSALKKKRLRDAAKEALLNPQAPPPVLAESSNSFRAVVERKAAERWDALATKLIDTALGSGQGAGPALKLIMEYLLGKPTEPRNESGPEQFYRAVMAAAAAATPGAKAELAEPPSDSPDGRTHADEESGGGPFWSESLAARGLPEAGHGRVSEREIDADGRGDILLDSLD